MKLITLASIAASSLGVFAFEDSSPFIVLSSTKELDFAHKTDEALSSVGGVIKSTLRALNKCPADAYILVNQPGLHVTDFDSDGSAPYLLSLLESAKSSYEAGSPYFDNKESTESITNKILDMCNAENVVVDYETGGYEHYIDTTPRVISIDFDALSESDSLRKDELRHNDDVLRSVIQYLPSPNYVVIYSSTPVTDSKTAPKVDAEFVETAAPAPAVTKLESNGTLPGNSLFENYTFVTPGILMSVIIVIIIGAVFLEGLTWLSDMQVSYKAVEPQSK